MKRFGQSEADNLLKVVESEMFKGIDGQFMPRLEQMFQERLNVEHAVAMNSAMSVLHSAVAAAGVGPGDEVVCDPVVHFGGAAAMYHNGVPVFCDIDADSMNMDPESLEACITERTRAIICTPIFGNPCDYDGILRVADKHGLPVIEDAAQAFGATYRGKAVGTCGAIGSFSFEQSKHLTSGDGGMGVTNRLELADAMRQIMIIGWRPRDRANVAERWKEGCLGWNFRMTDLAAAVLVAQMERADEIVAAHQRVGELYREAAKDCPWLVPQRIEEGATHTYWVIAFRFEGDSEGISIDTFKETLADHGCGVAIGYTQRSAAENPLFGEIRGYGSDCPIRCPHYKGEVRYGRGVTPVADRTIPRIVLTSANWLNLAAAEEYAEKLHGALKQFA
jgi:perosamine synthetase